MKSSWYDASSEIVIVFWTIWNDDDVKVSKLSFPPPPPPSPRSSRVSFRRNIAIRGANFFFFFSFQRRRRTFTKMNLFAILDQIGDLKKEKKRRRRKIVGKNSGKNWKNYSSSAQKMGIENRTTNARYGFTKKPEKGVQNWSSPLRSPRTIFNIKNGEHFQDLEFSAWISSRILERRREIESIEGRRFIRGAWMEGHTRCVTFELLPLSFDSTTIDAIRSCFGWSAANRVAFVRKVYRERRKISMLPGKGMRNNSRATVVTKGLTLWGTTRHVWFFLKYRFMQSVE